MGELRSGASDVAWDAKREICVFRLGVFRKSGLRSKYIRKSLKGR